MSNHRSPDIFTRVQWYAFQVAVTVSFILTLIRLLRYEMWGR